jgi:subtilisin family serine protease
MRRSTTRRPGSHTVSSRRSARAAALAALLSLVGIGAALAADDPYRPQQWGIDRVRAPEVWTATTGREIVVAIVDTGVDLTHPDLQERLLRDADGVVVGRDLVDDDDVPQDENGHGTMVAGIVGAMAGNGIGVVGTAPGALLMPVRVLDADGGGRVSDLDEGIRWAVDNGADVINLSLESVVASPAGQAGLPGSAPIAAVQYAWEQGVVVVAAAGNSEAPYTDYPSSSPALLVGATDREDRKAGFSDAGRRDAVMAPGVEIVSTWCRRVDDACDPDTRYGIADGTSFAAPFVSAAVAMLRELGFDHEASVARIRSSARDLGAEGPDLETGVGLLDVAAAVGDRTQPPSPVPTPSPTAVASPEVETAGESPAPLEPSPSPSATVAPSPEPTPEPTPSVTASPEPTSTPVTPREPSPPSPIAAPAPSQSQRTSAILLAVVLLIVTAVATGIALRED